MIPTLPPAVTALLLSLADDGGAIPYRDPRVTIAGLTGLRRRGLAMVMHVSGPWVVLTTDGRFSAEGGSMNRRPLKIRVGHVQEAALNMYVLESVHETEGMRLQSTPYGPLLVVTGDRDAAWRTLVDAANSADDGGDARFRDALQAVASQVLRRGRRAILAAATEAK